MINPPPIVEMGRRLLSLSCVALTLGCAAQAPQALYDEAGLVYDATTLVGANVAPKPVVAVAELQEPRGDDLVCRKEVRVGSHRNRRVCFTRAQLEEITEQAQLWLRTGGYQGSATVAR